MEIRFQVSDRWVGLARRLWARRGLLVGFTLGTGVSSLLVYAASISKPYHFSDGGVISASQVNADFDTLFTEVNAKETRITTLEAAAWTKGTAGLYTQESRVGIGTSSPGAKLEVTGGVKIGNDTSTCGSSNAGTMRFTGGQFQGCNGSAWVRLDNPIGTGLSQDDAAQSCKTLHQEYPSYSSGVFWIDPNGGSTSDAFRVYCDMTTDGGGWTVLSVNGDLNNHGCVHALRSDAPACGTTPDLQADWQAAGASQNTLSVAEVLWLAYSTPGTPYAATKLRFSSSQTVGNGIKTVTPVSLSGLTLLTSSGSALTSRTVLTVVDGYSLWGEPNSGCPSNVNYNLGMDVPTTSGSHDYQGWDDNNNGCGSSNAFSPSDLGSRRGYFAVR